MVGGGRELKIENGELKIKHITMYNYNFRKILNPLFVGLAIVSLYGSFILFKHCNPMVGICNGVLVLLGVLSFAAEKKEETISEKVYGEVESHDESDETSLL